MFEKIKRLRDSIISNRKTTLEILSESLDTRIKEQPNQEIFLENEFIFIRANPYRIKESWIAPSYGSHYSSLKDVLSEVLNQIDNITADTVNIWEKSVEDISLAENMRKGDE